MAAKRKTSKPSKYVTITRANGKKATLVRGGPAHKRHLAAKRAAKTRAKGRKRRR